MRHLRIMKVPFFIAILFLVLGCKTPQQKFEKLVKKYPELVSKKTITIHDTIELEGETIINHLPIKYKNLTIRFGEKFQFRYDSAGILISDSFLFKKDDVKIKLFADSGGLFMAIEYNKKVIEPSESIVKGKKLKSTLNITDSGVFSRTDMPDTALPIEVKTEVDHYCNHDIRKEKIKASLVTFFATLSFLMGAIYYGRKRED